MHLIVLTEAAQAEPLAAAAPGHDPTGLLQRWAPLWGRLAPSWQLVDEPDALNTMAERALAGLVLKQPWPPELDGRIPVAAWRARQRALSNGTTDSSKTKTTNHGTSASTAPQAPSARLTPFHGLVGSDRITLVPPSELRLSNEESLALHASVKELFASEGVALEWHSALEWTVQHESLRGLACASLARAVGDSVQRWQGRTPLAAARLMRRLQNEAQMVLHEHPVNQARAGRGELTVNSLWLDHAGAADEAGATLSAEAMDRLGQVRLERWTTCDQSLHAWVAAAMAANAHAADAGSGTASGKGADRGTGADESGSHASNTSSNATNRLDHLPTLVLCGRHKAQAFRIPPTPRGWRGLLTRLAGRTARPQALQAWLQQVDQAPAEESST